MKHKSTDDSPTVSESKNQKINPKVQKKPSIATKDSTASVKKRKFEKPTDTKKINSTQKPEFGKKPFQKNEKNVQHPTKTDGEKPDWSEFKKEKKELKEKRKAKRLTVVYESSVKAKMIGEKLRRADCSAADRKKYSKKMYELLKGNLNKAIFTHDMSRVVQWLIKYCEADIRKEIVTELKPSLILMFQSKYAKNCVKKALKHGTEEIRKEIIAACYGHVVKLVSHSVSSPLIDYAYSKFATNLNKLHFKQEFYGDMYKHAKDDNVKTISDVFASASDIKSATLSAVKINLVRSLNKKLVTSPIVQEVLNDYLGICSAEDRGEIIAMLASSIAELSRSESGARIAMICIWHGTNKDRKTALKAVKQQVKDVAKSEHGHRVLMAMFDSVDDTVLMKKLVLGEIITDLVEIAGNEHGRRVILYLVARRDGQYFHPALVEHLKQGDGNATSKKSAEIREKELVDVVIEPFLTSIAEDVTAWLANSSIAMVTLAIIKRGHGDKLEKAFEAIAEFIISEESTLKEEDGVERSAVEHSGLHMMLKKLILTDKSFAEREDCSTFGQVLAGKLDQDTIERWINFNRGCFLLILLVENAKEDVVKDLKSKVAKVEGALKSKKGHGASILLKKIK